MPFRLPTLDELQDLAVAAFAGRFPTKTTSKTSGNWKRLRVVNLVILDNHSHIRQVGLDVMPDTAEGEELKRHAGIWGVPLKGASGSSGDSAYRVFGDVGATVPVDEALKHLPSGLRFETKSGGLIPAAGFLDVDIAAVDVGVQTNLTTGPPADELTFDATPANLEATGRIVIDLTNGQDEEEQDDLRKRVINRIQEPAAGGNRNDWEVFVLESAAFVDTAFVYPSRNGAGTVDLVALKSGSGAARLLDAGERAIVFAAVDPLRPVSATHRVLETLEEETDVEALIVPVDDPAFSFDWEDSIPPTVLSYVPATRTLTFNAARPVSMAKGHRLIVDTAASSGAQAEIEALSGTDAVVLRDDLVTAPILNDLVYSGGPVTDVVRNSVLGLLDNLGPANPTDTPYGPWEGTLRLSTLFEVIQSADGVLDSTILDPVANIDATDYTFPNNAMVGLITPGKILIRKDTT